MYTVPIKTSIQAKKLIETFEKGRVVNGVAADGIDDVDSAAGDVVSPIVKRELSVEELAEPGTARKLLEAFEVRSISQTSNGDARNHAPRGNRLSRDAFSEFEKVNDNAEVKKPSIPSVLTETHHQEAIHHIAPKAGTDHDVTMHHNEPRSRKVVVCIDAVGDDAKCATDGVKFVGATIAALQHQNCSVLHTKLTCQAIQELNVEEERRRVLAADLLIVHFQPVLHCVPSLLQKWIEIVFSPLEHLPDSSLFQGKRCLVMVTSGKKQSECAGDISSFLLPLQSGVMRYLGYEVLAPLIIHKSATETANGNADDGDQHDERLQSWLNRLDRVWTENPITLGH